MPAAWVSAAVGVAGLLSSGSQADAASDAAGAQSAASQAGIEQQQKQFDAIQKLLAPYNTAGTNALGAQQNLIGLNGAAAQQSAISGIQSSPAFTSQLQAGNNNILANASATGGLRGGNVQSALGQFAPALLAQQIQQQYANLGGLVGIGQNAAAGTGNAGMQTGNNITQLLGQQGSYAAGNALAQGNATAGYANSFGNALGVYSGLGGTFGGGSSQGATGNYNPAISGNFYTSDNQFGYNGGQGF